jgi:hypothetical protein
MKIWFNLIIQKSLIKVSWWFLREDFHMQIYYWMYIMYWVPINNLEWNTVWTILFSTIPLHWLVHIFVLQRIIVKSGCIFIENNYINIFIIKLLMYNQLQILDFISFIIRYKCPKKGHCTKMGIVTPKVSHFNVHSPLTWPLLFLMKLTCYEWKLIILFNCI